MPTGVEFERMRGELQRAVREAEEKAGTREVDSRMETLRKKIEEISAELVYKANIKDVCAILDNKSNIEDVNKALGEIHGELDAKAGAEDLASSLHEQ